ncbi:MAG: aminotransferase class V-fold PLP-dependent enzyme [Chitinophagaceae bacterium]
MLSCQKHLFSLDEDWHYINCAYMSPLLRSAEQAGKDGLMKKRNPVNVRPEDFFNDGSEVRALFAGLVKADKDRIALIPSASYGLGIVIQNIKPAKGGRVVTVHEEFPSDVYSLHRICSDHQLELVTVQPPEDLNGRGRKWNERILDAITPNTSLVNLSSVHWADGTIFDLEAIGKRAKEVGALFVVDGTQSVGAMKVDVSRYHIDALICAGYKWLLGPYTSGMAFLGEYFDDGRPLEETWLNRLGSENFRGLVDYQPLYHPKASRYNMGECSNFINLPMQKAALAQILEWTPDAISAYCSQLTAPLVEYLTANGFWLEQEAYRAKHLFGFRLPGHLNIEAVQQELLKKKVVVSLRGNAVRVSPHVYNDHRDMQALTDALSILKHTD